MSGNDDPVEVEGEVKHQTAKAFLFDDGGIECWLPKSLCAWELGDADGYGIMTLPHWLATREGLI